MTPFAVRGFDNLGRRFHYRENLGRRVHCLTNADRRLDYRGSTMTCDTAQRVCIRPANIDVCLVRATTNVLEVVLTDAAGVSVDITNDTVKFTVRDGPGEHLDPTEGRTEFTIEKTEIDDEVARTTETYWFFEVRRITPAGVENVHIQGRLVITPDVGAGP